MELKMEPMIMNPLWKVEFHCHSVFSKDSLTQPEEILAVCRERGIDKVVITDHNEIAGALRAQALDPQRVIVGEEIMTTQGELLAAYVREKVPKGLEPMEAISALRDQGAFISVSHPFDRVRGGAWKTADLEKIVPMVDAIEVFNARCLNEVTNEAAAAFARQYGLVGTAGSDAHGAFELGRATILVEPFEDAASLKQALKTARIEGRLSSPMVHFYSRYATIMKRLFKSTRPIQV